MILTKDQILGTPDITTEVVKVPEWGGEVIVRVMPGEVRDAWESSRAQMPKDARMLNWRASLISRCVVNEAGEQIFDGEDVDALGKKSGRALNRVAEVCARINGLGDKDVEDLKGN